MLNKPFFLILFILIISQVVFSFYYSSEIISQNNSINKNQISLESVKNENHKLEIKLSSLSSLPQIEASASQKKYAEF